jgi:hypothetical protein
MANREGDLAIFWHLLRSEWRTLPRQRFQRWPRLLLVSLMSVTVLLALSNIRGGLGTALGMQLFSSLNWVLFTTMPVLAAWTAGSIILREHQGQTLGLLALSGVRLEWILLGRAACALARTGVAMLALAPLLFFLFSLGGLDLGMVMASSIALLKVVIVALAVGLLAGALATTELALMVLVIFLLWLISGLSWPSPMVTANNGTISWYLNNPTLLPLLRYPLMVVSALSEVLPVLILLFLANHFLRRRSRQQNALFSPRLITTMHAQDQRWRLAWQSFRQRQNERVRQRSALLAKRLPTGRLERFLLLGHSRPSFTHLAPLTAMECWRFRWLLSPFFRLYLPAVILGIGILIPISSLLEHRFLNALGEFNVTLAVIMFYDALAILIAGGLMNSLAFQRDRQTGVMDLLLSAVGPLDYLQEKSAAYRYACRIWALQAVLCGGLGLAINLCFDLPRGYGGPFDDPVGLFLSCLFYLLVLALVTLVSRFCSWFFGWWAPLVSLFACVMIAVLVSFLFAVDWPIGAVAVLYLFPLLNHSLRRSLMRHASK